MIIKLNNHIFNTDDIYYVILKDESFSFPQVAGTFPWWKVYVKMKNGDKLVVNDSKNEEDAKDCMDYIHYVLTNNKEPYDKPRITHLTLSNGGIIRGKGWVVTLDGIYSLEDEETTQKQSKKPRRIPVPEKTKLGKK